MSDYMYDLELPADMASYRFDLDVDLNQYIDPALLSLHAPNVDPGLDPAAHGLRPFDAGQSGEPICMQPGHLASGTVSSSHRMQATGPRSSKRDKIAALECDFPGCEHKGPFARKFELRRHVKSKHGGARAYTCGAQGCFKSGTTRRTFPRLDKLTDHIRTVHAHDTLFSGCPVDNCSFGPQTLDVLGVHVQRAHPRCEAEARSILNSTDTQRRRCPLSGCNNKLFVLDAFHAHLEKHEVDDLRAASSNASFDGLVFDILASPGIYDAVTPRVRIRVACPAFSDVCPSFENLKTHLWERHLFLDPLHGVEHFLHWQSYLTQFGVATLHPWTNPLLGFGKERRAQCPTCDHFIASYQMIPPGAQHPDLIKPTEQINLELKHVRMQILRLYPEFLSHPIFDDCA